MYDDALRPVLDKLGDMKVQRASNVRFDEDDQLWYIWVVRHGPNEGYDLKEDRIEPGYKLRADAIQAEIELLERKL